MPLHCETPPHLIDVCPDRNRPQEINREPLRIDRRQPFENPILKPRQPFRQTQFVLVSQVVVVIERATNRATVTVFKTCSLHNLVRRVMRLESRQVFLFYCRVTVKCFHLFSPRG